MPLVPFEKMLNIALKRKYAVGYFESWNQDSLEAILSAAEETNSPLVIGFGGMTVNQNWFNDWGLEYFAAVGRVAVAKSRIPVSFILNEVKTYEQCLRGIKLGFNVVMLDTSHLPFKDNLKMTRKLVRVAHAKKVAVEGELGRLPEGGKKQAGLLTDPDEAWEFVRVTEIDALSVSIGNVHVSTKGRCNIDLGLLARIREKTRIPLVIHGGSGFPPGMVKECIELGVAKFNVGTILKKEYYLGIAPTMKNILDDSQLQTIVGSREKRDFTYEGKRRVREKVKEILAVYGSIGKARDWRF